MPWCCSIVVKCVPSDKQPTTESYVATAKSEKSSTEVPKSSYPSNSPPLPAVTIDYVNATLDIPVPTLAVNSQSYVTVQLAVPARSTVGLTLNAAAADVPELAVYWKKGTEPTHTRYDFTKAFRQVTKYDFDPVRVELFACRLLVNCADQLCRPRLLLKKCWTMEFGL